MLTVDWTTVDAPPITLTLEQESNLNYIVVDGDVVYMRSPDLDMCCRFMRAMAVKKQAVLDEDSISWFRALGSHSVKAPALEEAESRLARGTDGGSASSNVIPLRRPLEPLDEETVA